MPSPTFLGIGVQKAGTSWLASLLAQHPEVAMAPDKEVHYFDSRVRTARGLGWYEDQFPDAPGAAAVGEYTPSYLWTLGTEADSVQARHQLGIAERVAEAYPDLRLIVSFRHPVDRAVSGLSENVRWGKVPPGLPLFEAAKLRPGILEKSRYPSNLEVWLRHFPADRFLFLVYEDDIVPDAAKADTLRRVFAHIGVDPSFEPEGLMARRYARLTPFELRRRNARRRYQLLMGLVPPPLRSSRIWDLPEDPEAERALWEMFEPDIPRLAALIGRPLPWAAPREITG